MHWVLQNNLFNEAGFQRLLDTLERMGISHSLHKVIPFIGVLSPPLSKGEDFTFPDEFDENYEPDLPPGPKIVMGSYSMAIYAAKKGWTPGAFANDNHDYSVQVEHWGDAMLNHDARIFPFCEIPKDPAGKRKLFFIRPVADSKCFAGHVCSWSQYQEWRTKILTLGADNGGTLEPSTLVMVSPVREIYREYRLWVVDQKVVTASLYKEGGRVIYREVPHNDPVLRYGSYYTGHPMNGRDSWVPARAFVLDIAETPDGYKILEVNCLNAAGFYAADLQKLVMALEGMNYNEN